MFGISCLSSHPCIWILFLFVSPTIINSYVFETLSPFGFCLGVRLFPLHSAFELRNYYLCEKTKNMDTLIYGRPEVRNEWKRQIETVNADGQ